MAENKVQVVESGDALLKMESFWKKNSKQILIVLGVIVAGIIGWYGYQSMVVQPKEDDAANIIFKAEQDFRIDSLNLALKGNPATKSKGFLYIVNNYSGTKAGNLSKYYSGLCYLRTGDFNNAVKYLSDFSTDAKQIQMTAYGALADAYGELVALLRMDGAPLPSITVAINKCFTSVRERKPSGEIGKAMREKNFHIAYFGLLRQS